MGQPDATDNIAGYEVSVVYSVYIVYCVYSVCI